MDELQETIETLIDLDEPEALLATLQRAAKRKKGERWQALAQVLGDAEVQLDLILNPKIAGPDFRPEATAPWPPAGLRPSTMEASAQSFAPAADAEAKTE